MLLWRHGGPLALILLSVHARLIAWLLMNVVLSLTLNLWILELFRHSPLIIWLVHPWSLESLAEWHETNMMLSIALITLMGYSISRILKVFLL